MLRLLFRLAGILSLAGAFVALVVDGTRSIAAGEPGMARLGEQLQQVLGPKYAVIQPAVERNISPLLWDPVLVRLFQAPTWGVLAIVGILLILLTKPREPQIGYSVRP